MKENKAIRKVMLSLDDELYFAIKKKAQEHHLPVASYVKLCIVKLIAQEGGNFDGTK